MVKVFADSTSDLDAPIAEKEGVGIIPLTVTLGEESFDDGAGVSFLEMSRRIEAEHIVPKTAAPSPQRFYDAFLPELQKGNTVLCFCVSSGISSTYQNACIARDQLKDVGRVDVIDSKACGISIGISAVLAARAGRAGLDHDTVYAQGLRRVSKMETLVLLDDLDYLVMGGRISALAAKAVSIMNIKPVITFDEAVSYTHLVNDIGAQNVAHRQGTLLFENGGYGGDQLRQGGAYGNDGDADDPLGHSQESG